jgi:hypothetical protein
MLMKWSIIIQAECELIMKISNFKENRGEFE